MVQVWYYSSDSAENYKGIFDKDERIWGIRGLKATKREFEQIWYIN